MKEEKEIQEMLDSYTQMLLDAKFSPVDKERIRDAIRRLHRQRQMIIAYRLGMISNMEERLN